MVKVLVLMCGLAAGCWASPNQVLLTMCPQSLNMCLNSGCTDLDNSVPLSAIPNTKYRAVVYDRDVSYTSRTFNNTNTTECLGHYFAEPEKYVGQDNFTLLKDGEVAMGANSLRLSPGSYCLYVSNKTELKLELAMCFRNPEKDPELFYLNFYSAMIAVSAGFLGVVLIIYCLLPPLRDLFGKCIMCFVANMFTGFLCLVLLQQQIFDISDTGCVLFAFLTYAALLAAFTWLNVISLHLYLTTRPTSKPVSRWRFLVYNIYVWILVGSFLFAAILIEYILPDSQPWVLRPGFGKFSCWFQGKLESTAYFNGPVAVLFFVNAVLYILTALQIFQRRSRDDKNTNFYLYLSVFIIMGVTWLAEALAGIFVVELRYTILFDIINSLQGLLVFIVLICRRRVYNLLRQKCCHKNESGGQNYYDMTTLEG